MAASINSEPKTPSRRALLAGALGGIGAWAASAIGRAGTAQAADGQQMVVGVTNQSTNTTFLTSNSATNAVFQATTAGSGTAVAGHTETGIGVYGRSFGEAGVEGDGGALAPGVLGVANGADKAALIGWHGGHATGVVGVSNDGVLGTLPAVKAKTGVYGYAAQDDESKGVYGESPEGFGIYGTSGWIGVIGTGPNIGVNGFSSGYIGLYGDSAATNAPATLGHSYGHSTGVLGYSGGFENPPAAKANTGVFGYSANGSGSKGVWGSSPSGHGIHGESSSGWAGFFDGKLFVSSYIQMREGTTPSAPGSNNARLFVRDNGSGKTQLCVRFATGAVKVLATQP